MKSIDELKKINLNEEIEKKKPSIYENFDNFIDN